MKVVDIVTNHEYDLDLKWGKYKSTREMRFDVIEKLLGNSWLMYTPLQFNYYSIRYDPYHFYQVALPVSSIDEASASDLK